MKQVRKRISSLLLSVCMVFTMLPAAAFAEEGVQDSGASSCVNEITAFADLAEDVSLQRVESGTTVDELNLPNTLTATVTSGSAITVAESVYSTATDSEAQESNRTETDITVSGWTSDPEYNPDYDTDGANTYIFKPGLDLPEGVTLTDGVEPPAITVTVNAPAARAALNFLPRSIPDTSSLVTAIQNAGLTAAVNEATVTVTGTATGGMILLDIGEGITVVWNAIYTSDNLIALKIRGAGTFRIIGGKLTSTSTSGTINVNTGSPLVVIDGGDKALHSGFLFIQWYAPGGRLVYLSGIINDNQINKIGKSVIAYYADENFKSKFTISDDSWTEGSNLFPLKDVVLTREDGTAYSYSDTAFEGTVTATLPDVLDLSGATVTSSVYNPNDYTVNINGNNISYSGTLNANDLTITVSGATVGGAPIGDFTTPQFGVNVIPITPVTYITGVPETMVAGESLALSGTVVPANATKQDISWRIKDAGETKASINGSTLSAIAVGMVKVTATIADGKSLGTDYTQDFTINITFIPVTDITDVPETMVAGESLELSGTVEPANATKNGILWEIKDAGSTGASIIGSTLSATAAGTVTVTATIADGKSLGTDYTQDFEISVKEVLTVDPTSYTFDTLEEGYGNDYLDKAEPKTFTITNIGNTPLTGLKVFKSGNNTDCYTITTDNLPDSLGSKASAKITVRPNSGLSAGTYETMLSIELGNEVLAAVPISLTVTETAPRLRFGGTDVHKLDADFSGTGCTWESRTKTLTLTSDYAAGRIESLNCDNETMTLKLAGDVTIDEHAASKLECIYSSGALTIDLGGHTLTLMTGGSNCEALCGDTLTIQNGTLVARLLGSSTRDETASISAALIVENATVTADADSFDYGGIRTYNLTLKQGAKIRGCGAIGIYFSSGTVLSLESDDISLTAIGSNSAIDLDTELKYSAGSALRSWTNTDITPPSPAGEGILLYTKTCSEWNSQWGTSKYVQIGTSAPEAVITGISVKSNPARLTYTEGDNLDLTGLAATLTYSDANTKDVSYTDFAANNISMTYADGGAAAQGDMLTTAQNGKAIILTAGSDTAQTNALTVKAVPNKYSVTVTNGTGSGEYAAGASVTITADAAAKGKRFDSWSIEPADVNFTQGSTTSAAVTFTMPAKPVTATAQYTELAPDTYAVNVLNDGHGIGSANVCAAAAATEITLTATPNSGYKFKEWQVLNGGVTITDNKFTMPAGNVTVKALFEAIPATIYTVTFNLNGGTRTGGGELTQTVANGGSATAPTITRSSYTFTGWDKDFTNVTQNLTVTAEWRSNGGGSGGSSGGGSGESSGSDGKAPVSVTHSQMSDAIEAAQEAARNTGEAPRVEFQMSGDSDTSPVETILPKSAVEALITGEIESLTLAGPVATMNFDAQAIAAISDAASGDVAFSASQVESSDLSDEARQLVGDRPVYDFSVTSGGNAITQFNGTVTLSIPYTPAAGEDVNAIVAYYINADGEPELMQNCYYDAQTGSLVFITTHFSQYAVGYNKVIFNDVSDSAWYAQAVSYIAARGITTGTSETTFSPDGTLTRGQFITLLFRAYSIKAGNSFEDNFSDAGNTYYTGYLAAAKQLGISEGVGNNKFAPEQAITRQEMFTLLYKALKVIDQLPEDSSGKTLLHYTDNAGIAAYAQEAMAYLVKAGVVKGNNKMLLPAETTTRGQMVQVLYNLMDK